MFQSFKVYEPSFQGPIPPEEAVKDLRKVIEKATVGGGYGGKFISSYDNGRWI